MAVVGEKEKSRGTLAYLFCGVVPRRNLIIALVVGVLLSVANQFDVLLVQSWTPRLRVKIFFNFLIPFVVSSASAWVNRQTP